MELRDAAWRIVTSPDIDTKLAPIPAGWTDTEPHLPTGRELPMRPGRPSRLQPVEIRRGKIPALGGMNSPEQRGRILHGFANHELQAVELFAWAILAFPDAPAAFRSGLAGLIGEEQHHTRLYIDRLASLGITFGDYPVTAYFWNKAADLSDPARFVCAMNLTFEHANLDHAADYADAARAAGDPETAAILDRVHADEVKHVRFGWTWLSRLKDPAESMWEAWTSRLSWPLQPIKAKAGQGRDAADARRFDETARRAAGMDDAFIALVRTAEPLPRPTVAAPASENEHE